MRWEYYTSYQADDLRLGLLSWVVYTEHRVYHRRIDFDRADCELLTESCRPITEQVILKPILSTEELIQSTAGV